MRLILNIDELDVTRVGLIQMNHMKNFDETLKYHFPPGAVEFNSFFARTNDFVSIKEFMKYVVAMRYLNYNKYTGGENVEFTIEAVSGNEMKNVVEAAVDSFLGASGCVVLNVSFNIKPESNGYIVKLNSPGVWVFFEVLGFYTSAFLAPID